MPLPKFENPPGPPPTDEQIAAIEEMAANGFTISEVCEVSGLDPFWFDNELGRSYKAYRTGFLQSQLELRQRIFKDARHGSSPAQALAKKILDDAEYKMNKT